MPLPEFLMALPGLELPFPPSQVEARAVRSDDAMVVFFLFHQDFEIPAHAHKAQWGVVVSGEVVLTIEGERHRYGPGMSYSIPAGAEHAAKVAAGSVVIDAFEEPDRYALRR